jgi:hypothetical protein
MPIRFRCPECGERLAAPWADARRPVDCAACGASIGVPADLSDGGGGEPDNAPPVAISPGDAARAASGITLLQISLGLYVLNVLVQAVISVAPPALAGKQPMLRQAPGQTDPLAIAGLVCGVAITIPAVALRATGYARCKPVGRAVRAGTALTVAEVGVIGQGAASICAAALALFGGNAATLGTLFLGGLVKLVGQGLEFAALRFFDRLPVGLHGRVTVYLSTVGVAVVAGFCPMCGLLTLVAGVAGPLLAGLLLAEPGAPQIIFAVVPNGAWAAGAVLLALAIGVVIIVQYFQILARARSGLLAVARESDGSPDLNPEA